MTMMARTTLVLWANLVLKYQDAVLAKIEANVSFESPVELCDTPTYETPEVIILVST